MAKAFDTLSHGYLREVFKFFNFGPNIIKWLSLLGENRSACILQDNGEYSRPFNLGRGRAQGDNISPNTFNFGEQILIFKIELDPNITGVWQNFVIPQHIKANTNPFFMHESLGETHKNESLADDNTTLMEFSESNLRYLRGILESFGKISGLKCNYDKTVVMPIGKVCKMNMNLHGFCLSNSVKLLGLDISNDLNELPANFTNIEKKIRDIILFWERFRLTFPGRIAVLKTLILPQLNYLGCFLSPDSDVLARIQELMDGFALKGQSISRDRRYLLPSQGGAGLFNLSDFLTAQKCAWVKRAITDVNDNWRLSLLASAPGGELFNLRACDIPREKSIILHEIAWAYEFFNGCYSLVDNNYRKSSIFQNIAFCRSGADNRLLDVDFFGKNFYSTNRVKIRSLTFDDCFIDGNFKSINDFRLMGLAFPVSLWMRLQSALLFSKKNNNYGTDPTLDGKSVSVFLGKIKRGSKLFRITIDKSRYLGDCPTNLSIVKTFSHITNTRIPNVSCLHSVLSAWNKSYLENHFREFLYKFRQNILRTKDRLAHLLNIDPNCSFCKCFSSPILNKESFYHLFRTCPFTSNTLLQFMNRKRIIIPDNTSTFDESYWYGMINQEVNNPTLFLFDAFRYCIWHFKVRKTVPDSGRFDTVINGLFTDIFDRRPSLLASFLATPHLTFFASSFQARG
jgi:hypothetical protein